MMNDKEKEFYNGLDGLRTVAALCIIIVHVIKNTGFVFNGYFFTEVICKLEVFVSLFFTLSAFSLCCGYYKKIKNNRFEVKEFYDRRYRKNWFVFVILLLLDGIISWDGTRTLAEVLFNIPLTFALFPDREMHIVGVGWTLGVTFAFYMFFPFFVYLIWTKRKAWITLVGSIIVSWCLPYIYNKTNFGLCNLPTWFIYFLCGGILYLYKDWYVIKIKKLRVLWLLLAVLSLFLWTALPNNVGKIDLFTIKTLLCICVWVMYAISFESVVLSNQFTSFVSGISLEVYLVHMAVYRVIMVIINKIWIINNTFLECVLLCCLVMICSILVAVILSKINCWVSQYGKEKLQ